MRESIMECFRFLILYCFLFSSIKIATTTLDTITLGQSIRDSETVVSADQRYELGFFSPGTSRSRYLGIWYKNIAPVTTVWVANRDAPISDPSGILHINSRGILVLLNRTNNIVWSSNASRTPQNPIAMLLGSGNLVVKDGNDNNPDNFLWQSFDHPGDTLLPGMKLGVNFVTGREWFLSSWKSSNDPSQGDFTMRIDPHGSPQLVLQKGPELVLRAGSWNGLHWTGAPTLKANSVYSYDFVSNEKEVSYVYYIHDSSVLSRTVMNQSGLAQRFTWINQTRTWAEFYAKMRDECDNYAQCGAYAICNINNFPVCTCFETFKPKSEQQWNVLNWTAGCIRKAPMDCQRGDDGFLKIEALKLPDTSHSRAEKNISLVECEKLCLKNCSCTAYATLDIVSGSGCLLWFTDLMDIKEILGGQDLYVRIAASELGKIESRRQHSWKKNVIIIVVSVVSVMGVLVLVWIMYAWKIKRRNEGNTDDNRKMDENGEGSRKDDSGLTMYDLKTIASATDNFSDKNKLGEGGFGPVYKGMLIEGQEIAVKRLSKCSGQGMNEFKNEVILIAKLQHRNLVKLLGCCAERDERMLIYEYMPNKSLDYFIFDITRREFLDWSKCIQIIRGIARGLLYLHQDSRLRIIHRDLKASNVLLDNDMNAKISDFGLARSFGGDQTEAETNRVVGTYGYMSPEYTIDGIFSVKSDVYSFGVLVLEILSGKRNRGFCHSDHNLNLLGHAWRLWNEERAVELIDKSLDYSAASSEILRYIHVGLLCVQQGPEDRPNMSTVVLMLGSEGLLPQPKQPGFFSERNVHKSESSSSKHLLSSTNEVTISLLEPR